VVQRPTWAGYQIDLEDIDRAGLAWEFVRRDPAYDAAIANVLVAIKPWLAVQSSCPRESNFP